MHTYRFRILSEQNEDFLLDIDVLANQTFLDLHNTIKSFCNINSNELASFYICDDKWRKKKEIMLIDMNLENSEQEQNSEPVILMEDIKLNQIINNPHQKFIYVYDFMKMHTFYVEMMSVKQSDDKQKYPLLVKKESTINLNIASKNIELIDDCFTNPIEEDSSFFEDDVQEEDLDTLGTDIYYDEYN